MVNRIIISQRFSKSQLVMLLAAFIVLGLAVVYASHAAGNSTISGTAFYDLNRNGVQDAGEAPIANQSIYLSDEPGLRQMGVGWTDANGKYTIAGLSDATYHVSYGSEDWWALRKDWTPSTTGSILPKTTVALIGSATVDFGWRRIVRSSDINTPISSYTTPLGTKINSFNDVVKASDIYTELAKGNLFGKEAPATTINFDFANSPNMMFAGVSGGTEPPWSNYRADLRIAYETWLDQVDNLLFHEYGHAWSLYYGYIAAQSTDFTEYLKIRGITDDPRLDTGHRWGRREMIAEDYRQLFGSPNAQSYRQENWDLPPAKDVPGLKEYLSTTFMTSTADFQAPTPPELKATVVSPTQVRLSWVPSTDNVGVTKYRITRYGTVDNVVKDVGPSVTTFDDTGLLPDVVYNYYVMAFDATNNRSMSEIVTVKTSTPDTIAPSVPTNLTGKATSTSEGSDITLNWTASTDNLGVDKYRVYRNGVQVGYVNSPSTTFADGGLAFNTSYQYYLEAVDAAGNTSAPSATITVATGSPDTQAPTAPTNLLSPSQTNSSISLKWNASTDNIGISGYRVYRVGGKGRNTFNTLLSTTTGTTYTAAGLSKGSSYAFYIVAIDAAGNQSPPSRTLTVKTKR